VKAEMLNLLRDIFATHCGHTWLERLVFAVDTGDTRFTPKTTTFLESYQLLLVECDPYCW